MSKTRWAVLLIVFVAMAVIAEAQKPATRQQMYEHLLPNPNNAQWVEWNTRYELVPVDQRVLFFRAKALGDLAIQQEKNIQELDKRVKALEAKLAEPNKPVDVKK